MNDTTTQNVESSGKKNEPKTVANDMPGRRIFPNLEEATTYLNAKAEELSDFSKIPLAAAGMDSDGNFDKTIYNESMQVMVATLKSKTKVKAIVVAPIPSIDSLLASDAGKSWLTKIIQKELNHVAVRPLREAEQVINVVDQMPLTMDAYISSARDSGGIMETFNVLYKIINDTLAGSVPVWKKARFIKGELKKAMESKGYAAEYYAALEDRGEGKDSLFVTALNLGIRAAKRKGLDPTIFERWLENRDAKTFTAEDEDEDDDFDLDSLEESLIEADTPATDEESNDAEPGTEDAEPATE